MANLQYLYNNFGGVQVNLDRMWGVGTADQIELVRSRILDIWDSALEEDVLNEQAFISNCNREIELILSTNIDSSIHEQLEPDQEDEVIHIADARDIADFPFPTPEECARVLDAIQQLEDQL